MTDEETKKTVQRPARRTNGTYPKGVSGNPKGRPKKDRRIPHPENIRDMQYDVAEFGMSATINGKRHKMNLLQANLLTLALAGAAGDKNAARSYLKHVQMCTEQELHEMARNIKRLDGLIPAYKREQDPAKRAELKEAWRRAIAEATGEREKTTGGLGRKSRLAGHSDDLLRARRQPGSRASAVNVDRQYRRPHIGCHANASKSGKFGSGRRVRRQLGHKTWVRLPARLGSAGREVNKLMALKLVNCETGYLLSRRRARSRQRRPRRQSGRQVRG